MQTTFPGDWDAEQEGCLFGLPLWCWGPAISQGEGGAELPFGFAPQKVLSGDSSLS